MGAERFPSTRRCGLSALGCGLWIASTPGSAQPARDPKPQASSQPAALSLKAEALASFPHINATAVGMLLFLAIFAGWTRWAWSRRRAAHFERMSQLPLED